MAFGSKKTEKDWWLWVRNNVFFIVVGGECGTVERGDLAKFLLLGGEKFLGGRVGNMVPFVMVATFEFCTEVIDFGLFDELNCFPGSLGLDLGDVGNCFLTKGII
jgi:hypothetical protein